MSGGARRKQEASARELAEQRRANRSMNTVTIAVTNFRDNPKLSKAKRPMTLDEWVDLQDILIRAVQDVAGLDEVSYALGTTIDSTLETIVDNMILKTYIETQNVPALRAILGEIARDFGQNLEYTVGSSDLVGGMS